MYIFASLLITSFIIHGQCRDLWSADLPQVSDLVLEKGKPLQLAKSHESVQISGLKGTLYSDSLSKLHGIKELRIHRHELTKIEKGALCSAPDIKILELDFYESENSLTHLTKEMFENCNNLEELILKFNSEKHAYTIDKNAVEELANLKHFAIQGYRINHLTKNFLKLNPTSLAQLTVSSAEISEVDSTTFEEFINLEILIIRHNRNWTYLPRDLFKGLLKLEKISVRDNGLTNVTWDEFDGLKSVKYLDVGSNKISSFDAEKIAKNLPNLENLFIELNPLPCKQTETFVNELKKLLDHPIEVVYKFDPGFYDPCKHDD